MQITLTIWKQGLTCEECLSDQHAVIWRRQTSLCTEKSRNMEIRRSNPDGADRLVWWGDDVIRCYMAQRKRKGHLITPTYWQDVSLKIYFGKKKKVTGVSMLVIKELWDRLPTCKNKHTSPLVTWKSNTNTWWQTQTEMCGTSTPHWAPNQKTGLMGSADIPDVCYPSPAFIQL